LLPLALSIFSSPLLVTNLKLAVMLRLLYLFTAISYPDEISGSNGGEYDVHCSGLFRRAVWWKFADVLEVLAAFIIRALIVLMMEAANRQID
jgi:hypothetical protein